MWEKKVQESHPDPARPSEVGRAEKEEGTEQETNNEGK